MALLHTKTSQKSQQKDNKIIYQFIKFYLKNSINYIILYFVNCQNILSITCIHNYHLSFNEERNTKLDRSRTEMTTL